MSLSANNLFYTNTNNNDVSNVLINYHNLTGNSELIEHPLSKYARDLFFSPTYNNNFFDAINWANSLGKYKNQHNLINPLVNNVLIKLTPPLTFTSTITLEGDLSDFTSLQRTAYCDAMDTLLGVSGGACVFTAGSIVATYTVSFGSYALKLAAVTSASPVLATATTAGEHFGHNVESISYSFSGSNPQYAVQWSGDNNSNLLGVVDQNSTLFESGDLEWKTGEENVRYNAPLLARHGIPMASGTVLGMTHDVNRETVDTNPTARFNQQTVAFWLVRNDVYSESDLPSWEKVGSGHFLTASDYTSDLYTRTFAANTTHTLDSVFSQYLFVLGTEYVRPRLQITLSGGDIEIDQSDSYTDLGHTVTDLESGATLNDVVTITVVDEYDNDQDIATFFQNHGTYILSYSLAAYAAYSDVLVTRRVTVLEPPHTYFGVVVTRDSYAESEQEKIDAGNEQAIADGHGYTDFVLYDFVATYQDDMEQHINNEFPWVAHNTPANNILYNQPAIKIAGDGATMIGTGNGSPSAAQNMAPGFMRIEATATNDSNRNLNHIYFGIAPTSATPYTYWSITDFEIMQNGVNILPTSTSQYDDSMTTTHPTPSSTHIYFVNPEFEDVLHEGESFTSWKGSLWPTHWDNHNQPLFYIEATAQLDGSQLTCKLGNGMYLTSISQTGHVVSSADGVNWTIRASWHSATTGINSTPFKTLVYDAWEKDTYPQPHFYCQAIEGRVTGAPLRFYISISTPNIARRGHVVSALTPAGPWKTVISKHGKQCDWFFDTPRYWYRDGLPRELLEQKGYNGAEFVGAGHQPPHPMGDGYYYKVPR